MASSSIVTTVRDQPLPHMPLVIETNKPKNAPGKRSDEA
jgi:hypothetical protein